MKQLSPCLRSAYIMVSRDQKHISSHIIYIDPVFIGSEKSGENNE